jgi:hypothetical protein
MFACFDARLYVDAYRYAASRCRELPDIAVIARVQDADTMSFEVAWSRSYRSAVDASQCRDVLRRLRRYRHLFVDVIIFDVFDVADGFVANYRRRPPGRRDISESSANEFS